MITIGLNGLRHAIVRGLDSTTLALKDTVDGELSLLPLLGYHFILSFLFDLLS